jgi:NhaP-type Na+/H+ and K+/H+ antiporter
MKLKILIAALLGLVFLYFGYVYATHTAGNLPSYLPGFQAGASNIHTKHSIAAFLLGIICFIYVWFQSGKKA